jgi:cytoskeletal protein RodZ
MKSFSLLAITALTLSGAAMAQSSSSSSSTTTQDSSKMQAQTAPAETSTAPSATSGSTTSSTTSGSTTSSTTSGSTTPSTTSASTQAPAPTVVEQKVDLTTEPGPPADMRAARTEAVNALAWAKSEGCRSDPSPRDCVRKAQDDYRQTMARLGNGPTERGTVSASGTSQASGSERAGRSDRN